MSTTELVELTPRQESFANDHDAMLCTKCRETGTVCVYSERPHKTIRWIIDRQGRVLDHAEFDRL